MAEIKYKNKHRSDSIINWLNDHILLSRSALCTKVGYAYSDLQKVLDGKMTIAAKDLDVFEQELGRYGYQPPIS